MSEFECMVEAAMNERMHQNGICPHNHDIIFEFGWIFYDGEAMRPWPGIRERARELMACDVSWRMCRNVRVFDI